MVTGAGIRLPRGSVWRVGMIGAYFNLIGPGGVGGDVVRTGYAMATSQRRAGALAAALMDRYAGLVGLTLVGAIASGWGWPTLREQMTTRWLAMGIWGLFAGLTLGLPLAAHFGLTLQKFLEQRRSSAARLPARLIESLLAYQNNWRSMLAGVSVAALSHGVIAVALLAAGRGLAATAEAPPTLTQVAVATPLTFLANSAPMPGGGLGVGEAVFDELLRLTAPGVATTGGAALFLSYRLLTIPFALAGLPFYWRGRKIVEDARAATQPESPE